MPTITGKSIYREQEKWDGPFEICKVEGNVILVRDGIPLKFEHHSCIRDGPNN